MGIFIFGSGRKDGKQAVLAINDFKTDSQSVEGSFKQVVFYQVITEFGALRSALAAEELEKGLYLSFLSEDGAFDYPGGAYDKGEVPTDKASGLRVSDSSNNPLLSISGFSLTIAQIQDLQTIQDFEKLFFGDKDSIDLGSGDDVIHSLGGDDFVSADSGHDKIYGGAGNDTLNGDAGDDRLEGGTGKDFLNGGDGKDLLNGEAGDDTLLGDKGTDTISGGAGKDRIQGGFGADVLNGGAGRDTFVYAGLAKFLESDPSKNKQDTIKDFRSGEDKIDVSFIQAKAFDFIGTDAFTNAGGEVRYRSSGRDTIVEVNADKDKAPEVSILLKGHFILDVGDLIL